MMPSLQQSPRFCSSLVDSINSLQSFLLELGDFLNHSSPRTLYLDLEGINLCREGTVSILTLLAHDGVGPDQLYLIDIKTLGSSAFTTTGPSSSPDSPDSPWTLKKVLESPNIHKVFFDVRNDADALYAHFGIRMHGVMDLQLMENASRPTNKRGKRLLHGLAKCVGDVSSLSEDEKKAWAVAKEKGQQLFSPEKGGSFAVFNERPLNDEIRIYCEQDAQCLPGLYKVYSDRIEVSGPSNWMGMIGEETEKRLVEVMSESYKPHGCEKAEAPVWDIKSFDCVEDWEDEMTAQDCEGWEDDMIKKGEW
jgi:exonuclease 3'-5' domain-containing protein 1